MQGVTAPALSHLADDGSGDVAGSSGSRSFSGDGRFWAGGSRAAAPVCPLGRRFWWRKLLPQNVFMRCMRIWGRPASAPAQAGAALIWTSHRCHAEVLFLGFLVQAMGLGYVW